MTVRLSVRTAIWRSQIARFAASIDGLVPVVKGNGYGFGRRHLADIAAEFSDTIAVGTVHELADLPDDLDVVVLTPTLTAPADATPILTVGRSEHIAALSGWAGRVIVKLGTELRRYGGDLAVVDEARAAGLDVIGVAMHPPIAGTDDQRVEQITTALTGVDPALEVWVSHLARDAYAALPDSHRYRLRVGTALWHGDKSALHLGADVLNVRAVEAGQPAGYQQGTVPASGHLVMIGAGTANGVTPLADGRSPFHFGRTRMALHEPPHMHSSMAFVPDGEPLPAIGDWVDVQRPLHMTAIDEYRWL
ncbi:alanine racemase [Ilumatobacter coccineus]|uniref:Alanine racemase N-terminal domain-containing protein n=1 Tax=Ilumatobacter coccineus (strain NBRC 103263 / KCTC 29153 / YM16-304) TaxID=1313172 RepID=A0A6C7E8G9_ILUCY|nr:alanine racemase [Ilumatobacter coccineus]BAN03954.1 hypothetical protein YM304_36400 [Ilumatobacter coccineus YM16-304]